MPDFLDRKSAKAANKKKKKPSVVWPRVWHAIRNPGFIWGSVAATLVTLAVVVFLGRGVTGTAGYAINQIELAIGQHNGTKLAYYADGAGIVSQVVNETTDWLVAHRGLGVVTGFDGVAEARGRRQKVQAAELAMEEQLNRAVSATLISHRSDSVGIADQVVRALTSLPPMTIVLGDDHLDVVSVGAPVARGDVAEIAVTLRYRELQVDLPVGIVMERQGRRWRAVAVSGLGDALNTVNTAQHERVAMDNRSIAERMAATVEVGAPTVDRTRRGAHHTTYLLRVPITNHSTDTVIGVMLALGTRSADASRAMPLEVHHPIAAGATSREVWQFDEPSSSHSAAATMLAHPDRLAVRVRDLVIDSAGRPDTMRAVTGAGASR